MKKMFLLTAVFALFLVFQFSKSAEETNSELQQVDVYLLQEEGERVMYEGRLFSGIAVFKDGDGSLVSETEYSNGVPYGICRVYCSTGQLYSETAFEDGVAMRVVLYHPNGNIKSEITFYDGIIDGYMSSFYPSGKPKGYTEYIEGKKNGVSVKYSESGDMEYFQIWEDDLLAKDGDKK